MTTQGELRQIQRFMRLNTAMWGGAVLILLVMVGLAYGQWREYRAARAVGLRMAAVQNSLELLVSSLLDAETGQRGFLLTGESRYLDVYQRAIVAAPAEVEKLDALLRSAKDGRDPDLARLQAAVAEKLAELRETVDLRRNRQTDAAVSVFLSDRGRRAMDEIRSESGAIRRHIDEERSAVQSRALGANRGALLVTILGAAVLLVLQVVGYVVIRKRTLDREEALSGMRTLHELGSRLSSQYDPRLLLDELLTAAEQITGADMGEIQLLDDKGALRIHAQHGFSQKFLDFFDTVRPNDASICGRAMMLGERVVVEDVEQSPVFLGTPALEVMRAAGSRAVQSTPLAGRSGELIGMLSTHYRTPRRPTDRDLRLLDLLARQAADLIEKSRADEALRESEERYRATFDNAPVGIAHVGLDGRWVRFNDAVCEILGYTREELSARTFAEITHPDDIEADWTLARRVAAGEIPTYSLEKRYIRKDGSTTWVNLTVSMMRGAAGSPLQYVSVLEDINERKVAENELRTTKEQLQVVADNMAAAVTRCSRDLRYIWVSRRYAQWLSREPEEIMGRRLADVIGERGFEDIRSHVERVLAGERVEYTAQVNFLGQSQRWIHAVYEPTYTHDQEVDGWIAVVLDITEEKRTAEQLRQTQRLESLGVLAGGIAHDFNNLLVGMLGNASLALDLLGEATPARPMLEDVISASERAAGLTRQLLAYAGKEQMATRPIHIAELVRELTGLLRASIPKNVYLTLDLADGLPLVEADQTQLQQVIMNLVINAAEAIPEDVAGSVKITAAARKPTTDDHLRAIAPLPVSDQTYVILTVADTGQGMTPEVQSRIFDPFFTTKFTGRGLGLSAVLGIVKAHQGAITLKTAPGEGTTITLLLPPARRAALVEPTPAMRKVRGGGTVLVVDDEQAVRLVAQRTLEHHGYRTLLAENGRQAIAMLKAHPEVVAIVLDLAMPDMTGDQAAPHLREINPGVPIVLSSGYPEGEARRKFDGAGITGFLQKPYRASTLIERLENVRAGLRAGGFSA
jgi:PAS domain S-box-containing protein